MLFSPYSFSCSCRLIKNAYSASWRYKGSTKREILIPLPDKKHRTRKALTRGRIDHFAAGVSYLSFPMKICFLSRVSRNWFSNFTFSRKKHFFVMWPWTMWLWFPIRSNRAMVIVWRVRGKIIRSIGLLCSIVCNNCAQSNAHTRTDLTVVCWLDLAFLRLCGLLEFICLRFSFWGLFCVIKFTCVFLLLLC